MTSSRALLSVSLVTAAVGSISWLVAAAWSSTSVQRSPGSWKGQLPPLFVTKAPRNISFQDELTYLQRTRQITRHELQGLEREIEQAQSRLGVPKSLLWCLLFQESRFDRFKNVHATRAARGLGQFTPSALGELNLDTDQYDPRTSQVLKSVVGKNALPMNFDVAKGIPKRRWAVRRNRKVPEPKKSSYFHLSTSVAASAAYLNNRYRQLQKSLDSQNLEYDRDVLWLYAAAAYNKGSRSVLVLLADHRNLAGPTRLEDVLKSPDLSYTLLTDEKKVSDALRGIWRGQRARAYVEEMVANMNAIYSCAVTDERRDERRQPAATRALGRGGSR